MSTWVENEFAERLVLTFPRGRRVSSMPFKVNSRCPICGDSATNEFKARFWVYEHKSGPLLCKCFNCGLSQKFTSFLKEQNEPLYREFLLEQRKYFGKETKSKPEHKFSTLAVPVIPEIKFSTRVDELVEDHPIRKYLAKRRIPENKLCKFYYTDRWQDLANSVKETYKDPRPEHRLVIPIFNSNGEIESFQGRALKKDDPRKYITIKTHEDANKIYGLESVDKSKPVMITEGPIDSMFLSNAISITGGSLDVSLVPFKDNRIWVLDNEPRAPETLKRMKKLIDQGETVCFWTDFDNQKKDINDMVISGSDPKDIEQYILSHSFYSLKAKLELKRFQKTSF